MYLKDRQIKAIEHIGTYKFNSSSQLVDLGLYKNKDDVSRNLKSLTEGKKPFLKVFKFATHPTIGKLEYFYSLTNYGVKFLVNELGYDKSEIKYSNSSFFSKDYFHRKYMINIHIGLRLWLNDNNGEVDFLTYDFDKVGNNRSSKKSEYLKSLNRIDIEDEGFIVPDIITNFKVLDQSYLFLFEQHNGFDTRRILNQIFKHCIALEEQAVAKRFNFKKSHRVAVILELENQKNSVIKRLQEIESFKIFNNHFIFKTNEELQNDFFNNWTLSNGENVGFIQNQQIEI